MVVHTVFFGNAAAARNGLTAMPVDSNEDFFQIEATNYLVNNTGRDLYIIGASLRSADESNIAAWRFHLTSEADWNTFTTMGVQGQDEAPVPGKILRLNKVFPAKAKLSCEANNANNSQVDVIVFFIADSPSDIIQFGSDNYNIPSGYEWRKFTGATTLTAAVASDVALTAVDFYPDEGQRYHIAAVAGIGATAIAFRVKHKQGGTENIRPGGFAGDTAAEDNAIQNYGDYGIWKGTNYPIIQMKAVAADTAQVVHLLCKKV